MQTERELVQVGGSGQCSLLRQTAQHFKLDEHTEQVRPDVEELLSIHEYERQRLGQELHDSAGQLLVSLQLSLAHLGDGCGSCASSCVVEELQAIVRRIDQEIRSLAFLHHPIELGTRGLEPALRSLARNFGQRTGIATYFRSIGDRLIEDESLSLALLRVTQEGLVNIYRHAHASHAQIVLHKRTNHVQLMISDDGVGISAAVMQDASGGIGLQAMRHRIRTLQGKFKIKSLGKGTQISAIMRLGN